MKNRMHLKLAAAAAIGMVFFSAPVIADPLAPGSSTYLLFYSNPLPAGYTVEATGLVDFNSATVTGKLGVTVLSGLTWNPLGGLTFLYEIQNTSLAGTEGITLFEVGGWAGVQTDVVQSDSYFLSPTGSAVFPGAASRSVDGNTISFSFPPGNSEPPIFAGQYGYQLIVFTDAAAYQSITGVISSEDFETQSSSSGIPDTLVTMSADTLSAVAAVPDRATTVILIGLGLVTVVLIAARWKSRQQLAQP